LIERAAERRDNDDPVSPLRPMAYYAMGYRSIAAERLAYRHDEQSNTLLR